MIVDGLMVPSDNAIFARSVADLTKILADAFHVPVIQLGTPPAFPILIAEEIVRRVSAEILEEARRACGINIAVQSSRNEPEFPARRLVRTRFPHLPARRRSCGLSDEQIALLRAEWPTEKPATEIVTALHALPGWHGTLHALRWHAEKLGLRRPPGASLAGLKARWPAGGYRNSLSAQQIALLRVDWPTDLPREIVLQKIHALPGWRGSPAALKWHAQQLGLKSGYRGTPMTAPASVGGAEPSASRRPAPQLRTRDGMISVGGLTVAEDEAHFGVAAVPAVDALAWGRRNGMSVRTFETRDIWLEAVNARRCALHLPPFVLLPPRVVAA